MNMAKGPRPWSIWSACALFLALATWRLVAGLTDIGLAQFGLSASYPSFDWDRDTTIVALSAEYTIALIPIFWILLVARPFARWMVTAFGIWKIIPLLISNFEYFRVHLWFELNPLVELFALVLSIVLLFTQSANNWFTGERLDNAEVV